MKLSESNPVDVEFVAAVLAAAEEGGDFWDLFTWRERIPYLKMADAVLRAIKLRELHE